MAKAVTVVGHKFIGFGYKFHPVLMVLLSYILLITFRDQSFHVTHQCAQWDKHRVCFCRHSVQVLQEIPQCLACVDIRFITILYYQCFLLQHAPHDAMVMIHLTMWASSGIYTSGVSWQVDWQRVCVLFSVALCLVLSSCMQSCACAHVCVVVVVFISTCLML